MPPPIPPAPPIPPPALDPGRLKHLEMIQALIARMAANSFLLKGWSATLVSAVLALAVNNKVYTVLWVAFIPILMFWLLDGWFLRQERLFRALWNARRVEPQNLPTDFDMDTSRLGAGVPSWPRAMLSTTLLLLHGGLLALIAAIMVFLCKAGLL